jgi:hypothetical protein
MATNMATSRPVHTFRHQRIVQDRPVAAHPTAGQPQVLVVDDQVMIRDCGAQLDVTAVRSPRDPAGLDLDATGHQAATHVQGLRRGRTRRYPCACTAGSCPLILDT